MSATLKTSVGGTLSAALHFVTARQIVKKGDATVVTPGVPGGFSVIQLKNATLDTAYTAATLNAPIKLGVDDVLLIPLQYPELSTL